MRIAVVGSRGITDEQMVQSMMDGIVHGIIKSHDLEEVTIISGGAVGPDSIAEQWARDRGHPRCIFLPNWNRYGKSAGFRRNAQIVENADMLIAFWDGKSNGTAYSIELAKQKGIPVTIVDPTGNISSYEVPTYRKDLK